MVAGGYRHTCALIADGGAVYCFGQGTQGQIGHGYFLDTAIPTAVVGLSNAITVTAGSAHSCALIADGTVRCWGANANGELGDGMFDGGDKMNTPVTVVWDAGDPLSGVVGITAGANHTCAELDAGGFVCWGINSSGQCGIGNTASPQRHPFPVVGFP